MPRTPQNRRCSARTKTGAPCKAWAIHDSDPPLCSLHTRRVLPTSDQRRCTALNADGSRCRNWTLTQTPAEEANTKELTLCSVHARVTPMSARRQDGSGRRCTGHTNSGRQCRRWAIPGSNPPLCAKHKPGRNLPGPQENEEGRRCTATTHNGHQCRRWAMRHSIEAYGRPLCHMHAVGKRWPTPDERQCSAHTQIGERCPRWAIRDSKATYGRWLCPFHVPEGDPRRMVHRPPRPGERQCTAISLRGKRCRRWALPPTADNPHPTLCYIHADPDNHPSIRHGYYRVDGPAFTQAEWAAIDAAWTAGRPLDAELLMTRLLVDRILHYLNTSTRPLIHDLNSIRLIFRGVRTIARLQQDRQAGAADREREEWARKVAEELDGEEKRLEN